MIGLATKTYDLRQGTLKMQPDPYKGHLVFDCDGTLISSQEGVFQCVSEFMATILKREVSRQEVIEKYTADIYEILERFEIPVEIRRDQQYLNKLWSQTAAKHSHDHPAFEGMNEMLSSLAKENYALYVWTARDRASTLELLKKVGIMPFIHDMRCLDDTTPKPHPQGIIELVGDFDKSKAMIIGDSFTDIQGANSFGCASIGALWSFHVDKKSLEKEGATYLASSVAECKEVIDQHFAKMKS